MADKQSAFRTEPGSQALHSAPRRSTDPGASGTLRTLVIDDDPGIRRTLALCLKGFGCSVEQAATGREALRTVRTQPVDLAFCDLRLEKESGLDLVPRLLAERPQLDVVVITAYAAVDTAVDAMRLGAKDYLPKPFTPEQIRGQVDRARERRRAELHLADDEAGFEDAAQLETTSPRMKAALEVLARAATHDVPVLLRGERGSGQGVLARRLHAQSPRRDRPFAVVGCAALSEESLAAEPSGPASDVARREAGFLESADGGTAFLDEVGDLSPALQEKVLRFLRERRFERAGETQPRTPDVRIVAATSRDLDAEVKAGRFREDLLYALNVVEVTVPALRERREDLPPLARALIAQLSSQADRVPPTLSRAAEGRLIAYSWPGNLRELRNAVERALILSPGKALGPESFPEPSSAPPTSQPVLGGKFSAEEIEKEHVRRVLSWAGSLEEAARVLGVAVTTLWRKRKRWTP